MIYKEFLGEKVSALALGCMRLPVKGDDRKIDEEEFGKMVDYGIDHGVNYFDTAWGYHDGQSEIAVGKALSKYPRDRYFLTTKFPGYDLRNFPNVKEIFEEQLKKCGVTYFDFYLCHNVNESNIDAYLDPQYGIVEFLVNMKKEGKIRHLGLSAHANYDNLKRFLDAYHDEMEFCQLQLNYVDWEFQKAKDRVELVRSYGLPVVVMEPLRGGKLAALPEQYMERLRGLRPDETAVGWAFRFLQSIPDVKVILNGASNPEQFAENIRTFETNEPLNATEMEAILQVAREMTGEKTVPCTGCRYCTSYCPMELDIPYLISLYNEHAYTEGGFLAPMALRSMDESKRPSACIGCGSCEAVCPQSIPVPEVFRKFNEAMEARKRG